MTRIWRQLRKFVSRKFWTFILLPITLFVKIRRIFFFVYFFVSHNSIMNKQNKWCTHMLKRTSIDIFCWSPLLWKCMEHRLVIIVHERYYILVFVCIITAAENNFSASTNYKKSIILWLLRRRGGRSNVVVGSNIWAGGQNELRKFSSL